MIYDGRSKRVLAARDPSGAEPLFWGATPNGSFMFGSDLVDLAACNPSATAFPAGRFGWIPDYSDHHSWVVVVYRIVKGPSQMAPSSLAPILES